MSALHILQQACFISKVQASQALLTSSGSSKVQETASEDTVRMLDNPVSDTFDNRRFRTPVQLFGILKAHRL